MSQFNYIGNGPPTFPGPAQSPAIYFDKQLDIEYFWDGIQGVWRALGLVTPAVDNITALGTTQGTATVLAPGKGLYNVTSAAANTGVILPPSVVGQETVVNNNTATATALVYPAVGERINALAINAGFVMAANTVY